MRLTRVLASTSCASWSRASSGWASSGWAGLLLLTISAHGVALEEPGDGFEPSPAAEPAPEPAALPKVQVIAVGALSVRELERTLGPALRSLYELDFSAADDFRKDDLFRAHIVSRASIHVWVDTTTERKARLYLANPDGTRFLVRDLELSDSMDEMDREAIAQAIEWSLQALTEGNTGLSRADAEALLAASQGPVTVPVDEGSERALAPWRSRPSGWAAEVGLLYRWAPHSSELPATQGPALRIGADRIFTGQQTGFAVGAQYQFPQRHAEPGVALELQSLALRAEVRSLWTRLVRGSGIGVYVGGGLDVAFTAPEALDPVSFQAMENGVGAVPLLSGGVVWQIRVEPSLRLELGLGVEVDLTHVHYDVVTSAGQEEFVTRWPVRPVTTVGVELF